MEDLGVAVADVEVCDVVADADDVVVEADELELVDFGEEVNDKEVEVVEAVEAVDEDVATIHWLSWQL